MVASDISALVLLLFFHFLDVGYYGIIRSSCFLEILIIVNHSLDKLYYYSNIFENKDSSDF